MLIELNLYKFFELLHLYKKLGIIEIL